jgi:uncharacterized membrane protein YozB (DUF420 family)
MFETEHINIKHFVMHKLNENFLVEALAILSRIGSEEHSQFVGEALHLNVFFVIFYLHCFIAL